MKMDEGDLSTAISFVTKPNYLVSNHRKKETSLGAFILLKYAREENKDWSRILKKLPQVQQLLHHGMVKSRLFQ